MALTLMSQWLNSSLPTQGPWVQSLVKELDPAVPQLKILNATAKTWRSQISQLRKAYLKLYLEKEPFRST